jgi:hypothetical protein
VKLAPLLLSLSFSALCAYGDLRLDDRLFTALLLTAFSIIVGVSWPQRAWLWGVIIGLGVPTAHLFARLRHWPEPQSNVAASFLALLPAVIGACGGMALRLGLRALREAPEGENQK